MSVWRTVLSSQVTGVWVWRTHFCPRRFDSEHWSKVFDHRVMERTVKEQMSFDDHCSSSEAKNQRGHTQGREAAATSSSQTMTRGWQRLEEDGSGPECADRGALADGRYGTPTVGALPKMLLCGHTQPEQQPGPHLPDDCAPGNI
eukprot:6464281-Amphidinium_carterae.1